MLNVVLIVLIDVINFFIQILSVEADVPEEIINWAISFIGFFLCGFFKKKEK